MQSERYIVEGSVDQRLLRKSLEAFSEEKYRNFSAALLPANTRLLGVRLPVLRSIAGKIVRADWRNYLLHAFNRFFEEVMLQGLTIACAHMPLEERLRWILNFLPKIDNWSVCDSFCISLKSAAQYPVEFWRFIEPLFYSQREYDVRFAVVMLNDFFVRRDYLEKAFAILSAVTHTGIAAKTAVAWALTTCYTKFPEETYQFLDGSLLDEFIYRKTLQKIRESHAVTAEWKARLAGLK
jgi:3-methyladenine DNA glycosylase AlkD